ncbi:MAG: sodium ion-translocating decarboxylase subunit beta [Acutalibacteraceae bacterium]
MRRRSSVFSSPSPCRACSACAGATAATAIIGAADGRPRFSSRTSIPPTWRHHRLAAYSYMASSHRAACASSAASPRKERRIRMEYKPASISKTTRICFPILITLIAGLVAPKSVALVGF